MTAATSNFFNFQSWTRKGAFWDLNLKPFGHFKKKTATLYAEVCSGPIPRKKGVFRPLRQGSGPKAAVPHREQRLDPVEGVLQPRDLDVPLKWRRGTDRKDRGEGVKGGCPG